MGAETTDSSKIFRNPGIKALKRVMSKPDSKKC